MFIPLLFKTLREHKAAIPENKDEWPENWKTPEYKTYPRCPSIPLPQPSESLGALEYALKERHSTRSFSGTPLTLQQVANLFNYSSGLRDPRRGSRFHPSGGGRYPLESYLVAYRINGLEPGIYHYAPQTHTLEKIADTTIAEQFRTTALGYEWSQDAAAFFALGAVWDRTTRKYGDFGYDLVHVEAGHISQNLALVAAVQGIGHCHLFGFNTEMTDALFDLPETESITYITALGK